MSHGRIFYMQSVSKHILIGLMFDIIVLQNYKDHDHNPSSMLADGIVVWPYLGRAGMVLLVLSLGVLRDGGVRRCFRSLPLMSSAVCKGSKWRLLGPYIDN